MFSPNVIDGIPEASQYVLTVLEGNSILQMSDGVPFQSEVMQYEYDYYSFYVLPQTNTSQPLSVTATSFGGDIDIACSTTNERPLWYGEQYTSISTTGADGILIYNPQPGTTYYCSAHGYIAGRYSMVISLAAPIQLVEGSPFHMSQTVGSTQYYTYEMGYRQRQPITIKRATQPGTRSQYSSPTAHRCRKWMTHAATSTRP